LGLVAWFGLGLGVDHEGSATSLDRGLKLVGDVTAIDANCHGELGMEVRGCLNRTSQPPLHWLARITIDGAEEVEGHRIGRKLKLRLELRLGLWLEGC
jgi:hypothetical protein